MIQDPARLLSPPREPADPLTLLVQAQGARDLPEALALLQAAAQGWMRQGEPRRAALALHRRAALTLHGGGDPVPDLAAAARLLPRKSEEQALVLLDLGQALLRAGDTRRATLVLRQSEGAARTSGNPELVAAARHALGKVATEVGDFASARDFLRGTGAALIADIEQDFLDTLGRAGSRATDPHTEATRARRVEAVEAELAQLKQEMGLGEGSVKPG